MTTAPPPAEQWRAEPDDSEESQGLQDPWRVVDPIGRVIARGITEGMARLIANAPANARLCEDLADALGLISRVRDTHADRYAREVLRRPTDIACAALKAAGRAPG